MAKKRRTVFHACLNFDRRLSRFLFGNDAGIYRFQYGNHLVRSNRNKDMSLDDSWNRGYKEIGSVLETPLIDRIVSKFSQLIDDEKIYIRRGNLNRVYRETGIDYNRIVRHVARYIPEINEIPRNPRVRAEIEAYFGSPFTALTTEAWRNWHLTEELERRGVLSNHWHHDSFRADTVKLYMLLHDCDAKHGPFHFLDAKKSVAAIRAAKNPRIDQVVPDGVEAADVRTLTGKRVTCC